MLYILLCFGRFFVCFRPLEEIVDTFLYCPVVSDFFSVSALFFDLFRYSSIGRWGFFWFTWGKKIL